MPPLAGMYNLTDDINAQLRLSENIGRGIGGYLQYRNIKKEKGRLDAIQQEVVGITSQAAQENWDSGKTLSALLEADTRVETKMAQAAYKSFLDRNSEKLKQDRLNKNIAAWKALVDPDTGQPRPGMEKNAEILLGRISAGLGIGQESPALSDIADRASDFMASGQVLPDETPRPPVRRDPQNLPTINTPEATPEAPRLARAGASIPDWMTGNPAGAVWNKVTGLFDKNMTDSSGTDFNKKPQPDDMVTANGEKMTRAQVKEKYPMQTTPASEIGTPEYYKKIEKLPAAQRKITQEVAQKYADMVRKESPYLTIEEVRAEARRIAEVAGWIF